MSNPGQDNETNKTYPKAYGIEVSYCEGLGYNYIYEMDENETWNEFCIMPDGTRCDAWDFVGGECGREYSLCETEGYTLRIGVEQYETYNKTYAICIFSDGSYCRESDFFNKDCHIVW